MMIVRPAAASFWSAPATTAIRSSTLPIAKGKARRCLERALDSCRAMEAPSFVARCLYDLGLLDKAGKRTSAARAKFEEAREMAAAVEATTLLAGIDAALAELPAA